FNRCASGQRNISECRGRLLLCCLCFCFGHALCDTLGFFCLAAGRFFFCLAAGHFFTLTQLLLMLNNAALGDCFEVVSRFCSQCFQIREQQPLNFSAAH